MNLDLHEVSKLIKSGRTSNLCQLCSGDTSKSYSAEPSGHIRDIKHEILSKAKISVAKHLRDINLKAREEKETKKQKKQEN